MTTGIAVSLAKDEGGRRVEDVSWALQGSWEKVKRGGGWCSSG